MDKEKQIHIKLPESLHKQLKVTCVLCDTTIQDYVVALLKNKLDKNGESLVTKNYKIH